MTCIEVLVFLFRNDTTSIDISTAKGTFSEKSFSIKYDIIYKTVDFKAEKL